MENSEINRQWKGSKLFTDIRSTSTGLNVQQIHYLAAVVQTKVIQFDPIL